MPFSVFPGVSVGAPWGIRGDPGGSREAFREDVGPRAGKLTVSRFRGQLCGPFGVLLGLTSAAYRDPFFGNLFGDPLGGLPGPLASPKKGSWELPGGQGGGSAPKEVAMTNAGTL